MPDRKTGLLDEVAYVNGRTRLFGIVGDPIEQVKSPEMFGAEFERRGANALMLPLHIRPADFDASINALMRLVNVDGLVFTIPYKGRALALAASLGSNGQRVGAINALRRMADGSWSGDIFDGVGCVEAFRRREINLIGRSVMLLGAGGAGAAIALAIAEEKPASIRIFDPDTRRAAELAAKTHSVDSSIRATAGAATLDGVDVLINASPVGMLADARLPLDVKTLSKSLVVFDAIMKPECTPLLMLAESCGCVTVRGREMMRGQISRMVDFFGYK